MSQRSAAKRLVSALHSHAQKTGQREFDLQMLRSISDKVNIKVNIFRFIIHTDVQHKTVKFTVEISKTRLFSLSLVEYSILLRSEYI